MSIESPNPQDLQVFSEDDWIAGIEEVSGVVHNRIRGFPQLAEDVVGAVIADTYRAAQEGRIGPGGLKPYLLTTAVNKVINCYRDGEKDKRHVAFEDESIDYKHKGPRRIAEIELERAELMEEVEDFISQLPGPQAKVMLALMRYYDEVDDNEIARKLGMSYAAFKAILHRARKKLKAEYPFLFQGKGSAVGDHLDVAGKVGAE